MNNTIIISRALTRMESEIETVSFCFDFMPSHGHFPSAAVREFDKETAYSDTSSSCPAAADRSRFSPCPLPSSCPFWTKYPHIISGLRPAWPRRPPDEFLPNPDPTFRHPPMRPILSDLPLFLLRELLFRFFLPWHLFVLASFFRLLLL